VTDPLAKRSALLLALFRLYLRWFFWRRFHAVRLTRASQIPSHPGRPLIIYCNHPSWWDPALLLLTLPRLLPGRIGIGPMDAAELQRYALLRHMGLFGIDPATPDGGRIFLRTALASLRRATTCLVITAEGAFTDPRLRPIRLRAGVARLARLAPHAMVIPLALEYGFWNESKPEALLHFGPPITLPPGETSVTSWQHALESGLTHAMDTLASQAAAREPAAFRTVFGGTAGVGGLYDLYRRTSAWARGTPFSARHQPEKT
jgi:1-acyl-sn-glycerol-3-phosphate acyltransferase